MNSSKIVKNPPTEVPDDRQQTASKDNVSKRALVQDKQPSSEGGDGATVFKSPNPLPANRRWIVVAVAVILGISGLAAGYAWHRHAESLIDANYLVLQGNIDVRQVNLAFKVDGRIETLMVDEGDTVKAGQIIASLDKRYFNNSLRVARASRDNLAAALAKLKHGSRPEEIAQSRAQLSQQQSTLDLARANVKRGDALLPQGALSKEEIEQRRQVAAAGEANVEYAQETLELSIIGPRQEDIDAAVALLAQQDATVIVSELQLADSDLVAPNDGIILTRAQERGAILPAGSTVFTLTLASPVWMRTYVNERDLGLISPGMSAEVTTDTAPDRPYSGHIGFISPTAEFTPKNVETRELRTDLVYRLRVMVENPDGGLRQGMPVTVSLPLERPRSKTFERRFR